MLLHILVLLGLDHDGALRIVQQHVLGVGTLGLNDWGHGRGWGQGYGYNQFQVRVGSGVGAGLR